MVYNPIMRLLFSALLAAASVCLAGPLSAATSEPKPPVPPSGNKPSANKKTATGEEVKPKAPAKADPKAALEPASLVPTTVDAATQMALEATKAAQAEVAKLSAIGGKVVTPENAKLAEAAVTVGVTAVKELTKAPAKEGKEEKSDGEAPAKGDKKLFGKKAN